MHLQKFLFNSSSCGKNPWVVCHPWVERYKQIKYRHNIYLYFWKNRKKTCNMIQKENGYRENKTFWYIRELILHIHTNLNIPKNLNCSNDFERNHFIIIQLQSYISTLQLIGEKEPKKSVTLFRDFRGCQSCLDSATAWPWTRWEILCCRSVCHHTCSFFTLNLQYHTNWTCSSTARARTVTPPWTNASAVWTFSSDLI